MPFPSPRDLHDPGIEPVSPALAGGSFPTESPGKPRNTCLTRVYFHIPSNLAETYLVDSDFWLYFKYLFFIFLTIINSCFDIFELQIPPSLIKLFFIFLGRVSRIFFWTLTHTSSSTHSAGAYRSLCARNCTEFRK